MLEALYKYAIEHDLTAKPGFKYKNVKYYISFSATGEYIGLEKVEDGTPQPLCPDIGTLANGKTKSNIIVEKAEVIFNLPEKNKKGELEFKREQKQKFYLDALNEAGEYDSYFKTAANGLIQNMESISSEFMQIKKAKGSDFIGIKVNDSPLESRTEYLEWWEDFRKGLDTKKRSGNARCFITGDIADPVKTVPVVQGLLSVGGHTKGDSFICFDKDCYQSYGFKQAANASVSEEAVTAVNAALAELIKKAPKPVAGAKNIHWFSEETENDVTVLPDFGFGGDDLNDDKNEKLLEDEQRVQKMFSALKNNTLPVMPQNRYFMMSLSGVNGRVMIRSYDEGTYDDLCNNLRLWYSDLAICKPSYGYSYPKLYGIYTRLINYNTDPKKLTEKIDKELSGISPGIVYSIYHGTPLPDTVAVKALAYIRSQMYGDNDDSKKKSAPIPDLTACQILKAWLNRKYRNQNKEESLIMDKLNVDSPSVAYQTGRLMAVYALIQNAALGDVGAGVVERYYTSACSSPALVMGKLATMSQYHLSKLKSDKPGMYTNYNKLLEEITVKIGTSLPKTFTLEQQSEFALGYYFQRSQRFTKKETEE
ncbi:type I-C CRISPR-associated protein Cas8c/Csd1 [uncultured Ruminococcus sp.]|nr:type I-C CRISPR-associated protein Cas8c/Csd1 [uncultured Ruminococcus sp.]